MWLHVPMGWESVALKKVLMRDILEGTDTKMREHCNRSENL